MNNTQLENLKASEIKAMAKELKIKNWWTLNKTQLITEIGKLQPQEPEVKLPELTHKEYRFLQAFHQDDFYDKDLESVLWTDILMDNTGYSNKVNRGIISSLVQKEILESYSTKESSNGGNCTDSTLALKELGKLVMIAIINGTIKEPGEKEPKEKTKTESKDFDNLITIKELAIEAKIREAKARRLLRNSDIERPYKRWEWDKEIHKDIITQIRKIINK